MGQYLPQCLKAKSTQYSFCKVYWEISPEIKNGKTRESLQFEQHLPVSINLSSGGNCGRICRTAQSRYPAAFKKISMEERLLSVALKNIRQTENFKNTLKIIVKESKHMSKQVTEYSSLVHLNKHTRNHIQNTFHQNSRRSISQN